VKKYSLSAAAAAMLAISFATAAGAAELPAYEKAGLPISAVQVQALGAADVAEQAQVGTSAAPHQLAVLAPRHKVTAATVKNETVGRATR